MVNVSSPAPPSSRRVAWLPPMTKVSSPAPPWASSGALAPFERYPRVVAMVEKKSGGSRPLNVASRRVP